MSIFNSRKELAISKSKVLKMIFDAQTIYGRAMALESQLREIRRDLHRHPELGFEEFRTTKKIVETLSRLPGIKIKDCECPTGVIAELPGTNPEAGMIGLRCDIDALPIQELNEHGYQSEIPGKMHACGHDGHVAVNLGAAMLLSEFRPECGVRFLFQPAEETKRSGAIDFLKVGALEGLKELWGFHLNATSDFGNIGWYDGNVMSGGFRFRLTIRGKSGHPAYPEACVNPIQVMSRFVVEMDSLKGAIRATRPFAFAFASLQSGVDMGEATPTEAELTCRVCYLDGGLERIIKARIQDIAARLCELYGATWKMVFFEGLPITYNDGKLGGRVREHAKEFGFPLEQIFPSMGGDDFGYYAQKVPAYYMTFGLRKGEDFPIAHTPHFDFDEKILPRAVAMFASVAL